MREAQAVVIVELHDFVVAGVDEDQLDRVFRVFAFVMASLSSERGVLASVDGDDLHAGAEAGFVGYGTDEHVVDVAVAW